MEQATALRDALVGADTVLDVWREPLSDLAGSVVAVDHSVALSVKLPAPPAAAHGAGGHRVTARRHAGVQRPDARRRAPADGHRLRPAGPQPRLSARRRSRALRGGLPGAGRRARAAAGRAPRASGGVGAALPGAQRLLRRPAGRLPWRRCAAAGSSPRSSSASSCSWSSARCWPARSTSATPRTRRSPTSSRPRRAATPPRSSRSSRAAGPAPRAGPAPTANTAALRHAGNVSIAEINPSSTFSVVSTRHGARGLGRGQLAAPGPVPARPPRWQRVRGLHDPAAGGQPADRQRRRLPQPLLVTAGPGAGQDRLMGRAHRAASGLAGPAGAHGWAAARPAGRARAGARAPAPRRAAGSRRAAASEARGGAWVRGPSRHRPRRGGGRDRSACP